MENTLENKARFFAQYWGQEVLRFDIIDEKSPQSRNAEVDFCLYPEFKEYNNWSLSHSYILLTPLSRITDEDGAKVFGFIPDIIQEEGYYDLKHSNAIFRWTALDIDYLRSKGYALSFMGLSVKTLVEYGWVKLKQI